jgi:hypothetical protein
MTGMIVDTINVNIIGVKLWFGSIVDALYFFGGLYEKDD